VGVLAPVCGRPDLLQRLVQAVKRPSFIDAALLRELRSSVTDCWKLQPHIAGIVSSEHLTTVHTHLAYLTELLESSLDPSVRKSLTSLATECLLILGTMYRDMQAVPTVAERYFKTASTIADEAGNQALKAVIHGWVSKLPIEYSIALAFLEEALPLARKYGTDTTYSWLQARMAEHLSIDPQYAVESEKALALATMFSPNGDPEHDPYWTCFNEANMYGYRASCYIPLQKPEAAKTALLQELQLSDPHNPNRQSIIQIDLARVYQLQGDITNACLYGHRALSLISRTRSLDHLRQLEEGFRSKFPAEETDSVLQAFDEHKMSVEELLRECTQLEGMR
jgi:tetratricopeptide (TPR) repeat protein